jgi:hypothetical protein
LFNRWGAALRAEHLEFCYHPHGYEFQPSTEGTLFDLLATRTDASLVSFQMDVFWSLWPGQNPVALLRRYPRRFPLMHLKDIARGARGNLTGQAPEDVSVPLGSALRTGRRSYKRPGAEAWSGITSRMSRRRLLSRSRRSRRKSPNPSCSCAVASPPTLRVRTSPSTGATPLLESSAGHFDGLHS